MKAARYVDTAPWSTRLNTLKEICVKNECQTFSSRSPSTVVLVASDFGVHFHILVYKNDVSSSSCKVSKWSTVRRPKIARRLNQC